MLTEKAQQIIDRIESRLSLIIAFSAGVGFVSGRLSTYSYWISQFGLVGWVMCGLLTSTLVMITIWAYYQVLLTQTKNAAIAKWSRKVNLVNPLDKEYNKLIIRLSDIVSPIDNCIRDKVFTHCELIGPINLVADGPVTMTYNKLVSCDIVGTKYNTVIYNCSAMSNVIITNCRIRNVTLFVGEDMAAKLKETGVDVVVSST